jgi:hypothetical protein
MITVCALLILVIPQLATAIIPIFRVMITMPAQMTAAIAKLDARTHLLTVMTTMLVPKTRVMRKRVAHILIPPASARQMTNVPLKHVILLMDAQANQFLVLLTVVTVTVVILQLVVTTLQFHVMTMTFVLLMSVILPLGVNITPLTVTTTMHALMTRAMIQLDVNTQ